MTTAAAPALASSLWAAHLLEETKNGTRRLASGHDALDSALQGGFDYGKLTALNAEANDPHATAVTHAILIQHLRPSSHARATVIDGSLGFDVGTVYDALVRRDGEQAALAVLERLQIMKIFDFVGLTEALAELRETLDTPARAPNGTVQDSQDEMLDSLTPPPVSGSHGSHFLLISDLSQLAAPMLRTNHTREQALLAATLRSLTHLSRMHNVCTVILNSATAFPKTEEARSQFASCTLRPGLGRTLAGAVDLECLVHKVPVTSEGARVLYGDGSGRSSEVRMKGVLEVLSDRSAGRVARWAGFDVNEGELR